MFAGQGRKEKKRKRIRYERIRYGIRDFRGRVWGRGRRGKADESGMRLRHDMKESESLIRIKRSSGQQRQKRMYMDNLAIAVV